MRNTEIVINLSDATETIKLWFEELFKNEIEEAKCAASNEHLFALGSDDEESATQHEENADENRLYVEILESALRQVRDTL